MAGARSVWEDSKHMPLRRNFAYSGIGCVGQMVFHLFDMAHPCIRSIEGYIAFLKLSDTHASSIKTRALSDFNQIRELQTNPLPVAPG